MKSFQQLSSACGHFRNAFQQGTRQLYAELERVGSLLDEAVSVVSKGCPLWEALVNLCIDDSPADEARILTFSGDSRKRLFLFALLARYDITEESLHELRTHVASLNDLRRWMHRRHLSTEGDDADFLMPPENLTWHPVMIGLPNAATVPRLLSVFLQPKVDFLLYPHQCPSFVRRQAGWSERLSANNDRAMESLAQLSEARPLRTSDRTDRLVVHEAVTVNVETTLKTKALLAGSLWKPVDIVSEVANLLLADTNLRKNNFF